MRQWLPVLDELLLRASDARTLLRLDPTLRHFPALRVVESAESSSGSAHPATPACVRDAISLEQSASLMTVGDIAEDLIELAYGDMRIAYKSHSLLCGDS